MMWSAVSRRSRSVASIPALCVVQPSLPYRTLDDLVAAGRTERGITMAVPNIGSVTHLMAEVLRAKSRPNFTVAAYRGAGQAIQDVLAGNVASFYDALLPTGQQVVAGRLRGVAVGSRNRSPMLPDVPTVVEQGYPELIGSGFYGLLAPANTPPAIVARLREAVVASLGADSPVRQRLIEQGYEVHASTPQEYTDFIRNEIARWTPVVRAAGIRVE